ncbi:MAG TPA: (d)CMP kinase [Pseudonocardiaceae bacterium]|nr:(d)CMP kinase [Pseudonocardiaceae bacterium]
MAESPSGATHIVAVDGPAAAGKTTTSLILAKRYGLSYLESGRAYRIMAYLALRAGVALDDEKALITLFRARFGTPDTRSRLLAEGAADENSLRGPDVSRAVSAVSRLPVLRAEITELIRRWALDQDRSIVEGRDIGTAVFPTAPVKFYLTADPEVRALRRVSGEPGSTYQDVLADITRRDHADTTRTASPLLPANDAIIIDTSRLDVRQVVDRMAENVGHSLDHFAHSTSQPSDAEHLIFRQ